MAPPKPRRTNVKEELLDPGILLGARDAAEQIPKGERFVAEERSSEIEQGFLRKSDREIDLDRRAAGDGGDGAPETADHEVERAREEREEDRRNQEEPEQPASSSVSGHGPGSAAGGGALELEKLLPAQGVAAELRLRVLGQYAIVGLSRLLEVPRLLLRFGELEEEVILG